MRRDGWRQVAGGLGLLALTACGGGDGGPAVPSVCGGMVESTPNMCDLELYGDGEWTWDGTGWDGNWIVGADFSTRQDGIVQTSASRTGGPQLFAVVNLADREGDLGAATVRVYRVVSGSVIGARTAVFGFDPIGHLVNGRGPAGVFPVSTLIDGPGLYILLVEALEDRAGHVRVSTGEHIWSFGFVTDPAGFQVEALAAQAFRVID